MKVQPRIRRRVAWMFRVVAGEFVWGVRTQRARGSEEKIDRTSERVAARSRDCGVSFERHDAPFETGDVPAARRDAPAVRIA
jgi:hypothetical protein